MREKSNLHLELISRGSATLTKQKRITVFCYR